MDDVNGDDLSSVENDVFNILIGDVGVSSRVRFSLLTPVIFSTYLFGNAHYGGACD